MIEPPESFRSFLDAYPAIGSGYQALGKAATEAGPLDRKSVHLVKLGIAIGMQHEGAVHAHARKALSIGCTADEVRHATVLAVTTMGFPSMMAAFTWVDDVIADITGQERLTPEGRL